MNNTIYERWKYEALEIINKCHPDNKEYLSTISDGMWLDDFALEITPMESVASYFEVSEYE